MKKCSLRAAPLARLFALAVTASLCCTGATLWGAPVWWKNIPDAFQHQKWGAKPGPNGALPAIVGAADPGGDGLSVLNLANGVSRIFGWQLNGAYNPPVPIPPGPFPNRNRAVARFTGWCNLATFTNLFYHFKQKGFAVTNANVANADDLHNEVRALARDMFELPGFSGLGNAKDLNKLLAEKRNISPTEVKNGLTSQSYMQGENTVKFMSSTNKEKNLPKTTLFDHLQTAHKFGDAASLRLGYAFEKLPQGAPQQALWWRGPLTNPGRFHSVAVAGFDAAANGTIWFADPDSNPMPGSATGNTNSDAGWQEALPLGTFNAAASDRWLAAPAAALPVKQRRFAAGAGVPKPAGNAPTQAEQDKLYFKGTLNANKTEFAIADADYKRYDTVKIRYLETVEVVKAGKQPRVPAAAQLEGEPSGGGAGGEPFTFQVTPGQSNTGPDAISGRIDEFFLFPANKAEQIAAITNLRVNNAPASSLLVLDPMVLLPNVWNVYLYAPNSVDPWGNSLPFGGVSVRAGAGVSALTGLDLLEFDYVTQGLGELLAWDFLYNDSTDGTLSSVGVQVLGGGYDLALLQLSIPEPSTLLMISCGLALVALQMRNRRSRRDKRA